jgi:hypothetical protein
MTKRRWSRNIIPSPDVEDVAQEDRKFDVLAFSVPPGGRGQLGLVFADKNESGFLTRGIQRLAQRFLIELLTERGSILNKPRRGNSLIWQINAGLLQTTADLFTAFSLAEAEIRENLLEEETSDMPPDERYLSAELLQLSLSGSRVVLNIRLTSLAGESRKYEFKIKDRPTND